MNEFAVWYELGDIYLKAASYDEAIEAYAKAIDLAPNFGWPYRNLASAYLSKGRFAEAVPLLLKSIDLLHSNAEKAISFNRLGDAYRQLGDYQLALDAYQQADALSSDTSGDYPEPAARVNPTIAPAAEPPAGAMQAAPADPPVEGVPLPEAVDIAEGETTAEVEETSVATPVTQHIELEVQVPVAEAAPPQVEAPLSSEEASAPSMAAENKPLDLETIPEGEESPVSSQEVLASEPVAERANPESDSPPAFEEIPVAGPTMQAVELKVEVAVAEAAPESETPVAAEDVEPATEATPDIETPVTATETSASDAVAKRGVPITDTNGVEVVTFEQDVVSEENETDASAEDPALDIAPSVSIQETKTEAPASASANTVDTVAESETHPGRYAAEPSIHQELDTDLLAQAAYELKQSTLPSNRFSRWVKNFKKILQKGDLLNEALKDDFLYDIELENENAPEEQPSSSTLPPKVQDPVQDPAADTVESVPLSIEADTAPEVMEGDPVTESVDPETEVPATTETESDEDSPPPVEAVPVADTVVENSVTDVETSPMEAAAEAEPPTSAENNPTSVSQHEEIAQEVVDTPEVKAAESQLPIASRADRDAESIEPGVKTGTADARGEDNLPVSSAADAGDEQVPANAVGSEPPVTPAADPIVEPVSEVAEPKLEGYAAAADELSTEGVEMDLEADNTEPELETRAFPAIADKSTEILPEEHVSTSSDGKNGQDNKSAFEWNCLGNVYLKAGSYDEAISAYTKAIEMAPKVGWPYRNLASAYFYKGMTAVAIPLYKRSIDLLSNNSEKAVSLNKLGDAYRQLGDYQNAMVAYQKADDLNADINSLLNRARLLVSNGGQD